MSTSQAMKTTSESSSDNSAKWYFIIKLAAFVVFFGGLGLSVLVDNHHAKTFHGTVIRISRSGETLQVSSRHDTIVCTADNCGLIRQGDTIKLSMCNVGNDVDYPSDYACRKVVILRETKP